MLIVLFRIVLSIELIEPIDNSVQLDDIQCSVPAHRNQIQLISLEFNTLGMNSIHGCSGE